MNSLQIPLNRPLRQQRRRGWQIVAAGGIIISLLAASLAGTAVFAANGGSTITTSPIAVDLSAAPGSTASTNLQVENNAPKAIGISVKLKEFKANGDNGQAQILTPPPGDASVSWVHFSRTSFVAQPGVWNNVTMTISLPKTAAFGYYYAVLFVPNVNVHASAQNTNTVKGANAVLVLLDAHTPNDNNSLKVQSYQVDKSSYQYLPVSFSVKVRNTGNIFTVPEGDIYISRTEGGPAIDTLDINSGAGNVLPGTNRIFEAQWTDGFPVYQLKRVNGQIVSDKKGQPVQQLAWNINKITKFRYGKYYAHLVLVYNDGGRDIPINGEVSFWVVPWLLLVGLLVFLGLVLVGLWTILRHLIKPLKAARRK
jgi:hypothetical protein